MSLPLFALAYAAGATLHKGLGFVLLLWLARAMPVDDYARFGLLFALQAGLATLAGAGIGDAAIGRTNHPDQPVTAAQLFRSSNTVFVMLSSSASLLAVVAYFSLPNGAAGTGWALLFVVIAGVLTALFALHAALARLDEHHRASLVLGSLVPMAGLVGAFVGFALQRGVTGVFAGMAAGLGGALVACRIARLGHYGLAWKAPETAAIAKAAGPYLLIALLAWLGGYGSTYFVQTLFTPRDVAMFTFAYTLSSILQLVASSANQVWGPRFYRLARSLPVPDLERRNVVFFSRQGLTLGAAGAVVLLGLRPALDALGGNLVEYRDTVPLVAILFAGYAVAVPWWHVQNYYLFHGKGAELMRVVLVTSGIGLVVWLCSMQLLGVTGIYFGFLLNMLIRSAGVWWAARRHWPVRLAWQGSAIALLMVGAATAIAEAARPH